MKIVAKKYVNARTGAPATSSPCPYYRSPGEILEITEIVFGQEYEGSVIWYKGDDEQFYWSGGFETEFALSKNAFQSLPNDRKEIILRECVRELYNYYKNNVAGFTGIGISNKHTGRVYTSDLGLTIQVVQKDSSAPFQIDGIRYKGYLINTDVVPTSIPKAISPGTYLSRDNSNNFGTIGFYASNPSGHFLVTNYHVVCDHLLKEGRKSYSFNTNELFNIVSPNHGNDFSKAAGFLFSGMLSDYKDVAMVRVLLKKLNTNGALSFSGHISLSQIAQHTTVHIWTTSGTKGTMVEGKNYSSPINYGLPLLHQLSGLIKMTLCTKPGDSGSPIVYANKLVGIAVAQDNTFTYGLPIENILPKNMIVL